MVKIQFFHEIHIFSFRDHVKEGHCDDFAGLSKNRTKWVFIRGIDCIFSPAVGLQAQGAGRTHANTAKMTLSCCASHGLQILTHVSL